MPFVDFDKCPDDWLAYIKQMALEYIYRNAYYAFQEIEDRMKAVATAEELGVPSPDPEGRSLAELTKVFEDGKALFKSIFDKVQAATSVAEINETLGNLQKSGVTWLVDEGWAPFATECNWGEGAQ